MKDTPNKVTTVLKVVVTGEFYDNDATDETLRYAVEQDLEDAGFDVDITLLKQEAVEARKKNDGKPQPWTSWWYVCGDCGQEIEYHDRYCRWCGRSVKWE